MEVILGQVPMGMEPLEILSLIGIAYLRYVEIL